LRLALLGPLIACSDGDSAVGPPCAAWMYETEIAVSNIDRVDVLFVISDAPSMIEEQAMLRTQLPVLMRSAVTGEVDGAEVAPPVQDLKVAVVSASLADGGEFHRAPADAALGCDELPDFLRYRGTYFGPDRDDPDTFIDQFACLARVGTAGAAPNEPLEASLLALSDPQRAKAFLRSVPADGLSLIQVIVIADSDDCSLPSGSGSAQPATSAACVDEAGTLESVQHYVDGLKALRPGNENLVSFSVLTGVPPALVDDQARSRVDFSSDASRDAYYQRIFDDPAMNAVPDPMSTGHVLPACRSEHASAEPGRRLIEAVRAFGENGDVFSICSDDWLGLFAPLQRSIATQIDALCLSRALRRGADGRVPCKVYWDLPPPDRAPEGTPTRCSQRPYLKPAPGTPREPGGQRCEMRQLAIDDEADLAAADLDDGGWYYDDFSEAVRHECVGPDRKVSFTPYSTPQSGITVTLACFTEQVLPGAAQDAGGVDAAACGVP
jgi:hypothetical protein